MDTKTKLYQASKSVKDILRKSSSMYPKKRNSRQQEHYEQADFFKWLKTLYPEVGEVAFAICNGANVSDAERGKLVREGLNPGIPDIFIPVPAGGYPGLFIEMKVGSNTCSPEQEDRIARLKRNGYRCEVCYGWNIAADMFVNYINGRL